MTNDPHLQNKEKAFIAAKHLISIGWNKRNKHDPLRREHLDQAVKDFGIADGTIRKAVWVEASKIRKTLKQAFFKGQISLRSAASIVFKIKPERQLEILDRLIKISDREGEEFLHDPPPEYLLEERHHKPRVMKKHDIKKIGIKKSNKDEKKRTEIFDKIDKFVVELEIECAKEKFMVCVATIAIVAHKIKTLAKVQNLKGLHIIVKELTHQGRGSVNALSMNKLRDLTKQLKTVIINLKEVQNGNKTQKQQVASPDEGTISSSSGMESPSQ